MDFINLTPHTINVCNDDSEVVMTLPASGRLVRVARSAVSRPSGFGFNFNSVSYGEVSGLPDEVEGVVLVVSLAVRSALPDRKDLASPGELVRDAEGQPVGCKGLDLN